MNNYLVFMPENGGMVEQAFPQAHHQVGDDLWAINSDLPTCVDVCERLGIEDGLRPFRSCAVAATRFLEQGMNRPAEVIDLPEGRPSSGGGGNGGASHGERLARIEAKMEHVATREDLAKIQVLIERKESTMLRWLLGMVAVAGISLVVALIRVFLD